MIGHVALFMATFVGAAAVALGFPSRTGSEACPARIVSSQAAVQPSTNVHEQGVAVGNRKLRHSGLTATRQC
jgi:hypothetical protein